MGGIVCVTPKTAVYTNIRIPRKGVDKKEDGSCCGVMPITVYQFPKARGLTLLKAEDVTLLNLRPDTLEVARRQDMLWICGMWLKNKAQPGWSGFMDSTSTASRMSYEMSGVLPLPFANLDPGNPSTIYTSLLFAAEHSKKYNQSNCIVTFDQPLYAKAMDIVMGADKKNPVASVVVRLGGFHLLMSFMGAIGTIMSGSGIEAVWETIYSSNTVVHMMSGHAYARALRAHFLTQLAIAVICLEKSILSEDTVRDVTTSYDALLRDDVKITDIAELKHLRDMVASMDAKLTSLSSDSRTAKLWVQYYHQVDIIRIFIRAERCGDWKLHLYAVQQMLPYLHAAGHLHYAKSAHMYLQEMNKLEQILTPSHYQRFVVDGCFTVRRSDKHWSGVWSDMTIEQVLMRAMKCTGGLTHGRGLSDATLNRLVNAMAVSTAVSTAVEVFTGVVSTSSE